MINGRMKESDKLENEGESDKWKNERVINGRMKESDKRENEGE